MPVVTTVLHPENSPDVDLHPETDAGQVTDFLNKTYPVGTVYMSLQSTSPASLFGGTWTAITAGFLASAGYSGITAGSVGGNKEISLNDNQLPTTVLTLKINLSGESVTYAGQFVTSSTTVLNGNTGLISKGEQHRYGSPYSQQNINILNPYYGVYMWRRVA